MKFKYKYSYNENNGTSKCDIIYKHRCFTGRAFIHPEDRDVQSERTGAVLAQARATILVLKHIIQNELRPALEATKRIYNNMSTSKNFREDSFEAKRLRLEIRRLENELATTKEQLVGEEQGIKEYIEIKERLYQRIRQGKKE